MKKAAFIGLGVMGHPMAGHLSKSGLDLTVFNRTRSKAQSWVQEYPGKMADSPEDAVRDADFVFTCVGDDSDLYSIYAEEKGILWGIKQGSIVVDHTTASASMAKKLNRELEERGSAFIDAPVSGGQEGAEKAALTIMCGGRPEIYESIVPIIKAYAKKSVLLGPVGSGQLCKMVNQICVAGVIQGLSEGLFFAEKAGLDLNKTVEAISKGAAGSWQMENRSETMIKGEFEHGFAVEWMRKDLDICFKEAEKLGTRLPVTKLIDGLYRKVMEQGGDRWDTSSLIKVLRDND
uniref:3-hydroxyisobutyrate dehydrogenase/related beta-hydroxyacid dehydrogenase n=1 Tax=Uncultured bacterium HF130_AEPn_1 TaxID=663362 RepID=D0E8I9_UNCHF|nr:3-hydroxyisobutyrate dehydrogenase/related beta-hydroxyacid dehydrogenase [uncultured bacterium HF130_AEPn_1]